MAHRNTKQDRRPVTIGAAVLPSFCVSAQAAGAGPNGIVYRSSPGSRVATLPMPGGGQLPVR